MAPERIRGVIFDLDGTLIQSSIDFSKMKRRMIEILEANGVSKGALTPNETTVATLDKAEKIWDEQGKPENERNAVRRDLDETMDQVELEAIPLVTEVAGATGAIRNLKEMGFKLAVLTRSHHAYAVEALRKIRAENYFDLILGRGETPKPKPYAEALQHASKLMGLPLKEVIFIGDHHIDSTCAQNAECHFVGVRSGSRGEDSWEKNRPEVLLDSVADLPSYLSTL
jgi:phosphoglycolate phosphatase-like HAD superfamily hydrolase